MGNHVTQLAVESSPLPERPGDQIQSATRNKAFGPVDSLSGGREKKIEATANLLASGKLIWTRTPNLVYTARESLEPSFDFNGT